MTFDARLEKAVELAPRTRGLRFRVLGGKTLDFKAGQHLKLFASAGANPMYFSIASPPRLNDAFELCVTRVAGGAKASEFMHLLPEGGELKAEGPLGKFTLPDGEPPRDAVFVAAGSGIAPLRSMILDLVDRGTLRELRLLFGVRTENDILYREEWKTLEEACPNFKARFILSRPEGVWTGNKGYVQDQLKSGDFVAQPREADYYICGLAKMIEGVKAGLMALGVDEARVHYERYD